MVRLDGILLLFSFALNFTANAAAPADSDKGVCNPSLEAVLDATTTARSESAFDLLVSRRQIGITVDTNTENKTSPPTELIKPRSVTGILTQRRKWDAAGVLDRRLRSDAGISRGVGRGSGGRVEPESIFPSDLITGSNSRSYSAKELERILKILDPENILKVKIEEPVGAVYFYQHAGKTVEIKDDVFGAFIYGLKKYEELKAFYKQSDSIAYNEENIYKYLGASFISVIKKAGRDGIVFLHAGHLRNLLRDCYDHPIGNTQELEFSQKMEFTIYKLVALTEHDSELQIVKQIQDAYDIFGEKNLKRNYLDFMRQLRASLLEPNATEYSVPLSDGGTVKSSLDRELLRKVLDKYGAVRHLASRSNTSAQYYKEQLKQAAVDFGERDEQQRVDLNLMRVLISLEIQKRNYTEVSVGDHMKEFVRFFNNPTTPY